MLDGSGACRLKQQELVDLADADGVVDGGWELGGATRNGRLSSFDGRSSRSKEPTVVNG